MNKLSVYEKYCKNEEHAKEVEKYALMILSALKDAVEAYKNITEREKQEKVFPCGTLFLMCPKRGNFGLYFPNMENIMGKSQDVVFKTRSIPGENIKLLQRRS